MTLTFDQAAYRNLLAEVAPKVIEDVGFLQGFTNLTGTTALSFHLQPT
jgi:hypothetical protein